MKSPKMLESNQNWNKDVSEYGQDACPNLIMHMKVSFYTFVNRITGGRN